MIPHLASFQNSLLQRRAKGAWSHSQIQTSLDNTKHSDFMRKGQWKDSLHSSWWPMDRQRNWAFELKGNKPTATCKECATKGLCVLMSFTSPEVPPSPLPPPPSLYSAASNAPRRGDCGTQLRATVNLLEQIYESTKICMAPNDVKSATITFDTGVAQGYFSITCPQLFNIFINALLRMFMATGQSQGISHSLQIGKDHEDSRQEADHGNQFNNMGFINDIFNLLTPQKDCKFC